MLPSPFSNSKWSKWLIAYFYSGWAFLIPYLSAYLLYAWLKSPVNPSEAADAQQSASSQPSLLHVYWFLHALHLILAPIALAAWWRKSPPPDGSPRPSLGKGGPAAHRLQSTAYRLIPWLLLALIFWSPGVYLEWPSDPWEHLRRINEWHAHGLVTEHSSWMKSSYFLPYTLTGHTTGLGQLSWLNLYYVGICLLLCWQYFRLARAVSLGERASFLFVLLQAMLMGNNTFSFYRYYGLSSSIYAQLGAVALTRIAVEYCSGLRLMQNRRQGASRKAESALSDTCRSSFQAASALIALLLLIAFNHVQGLGIAGLGMLAVVVWRLIEWKRTMIGWLAGAAIGLSVATVFWFPRHSALDEIYRSQGWLTPWYGFNLFSLGSPAFDRAYQIIGAFGVINLGVSLWLLRKNHLAGWLTAMPVLALGLPCFALPLAHVLATQSSSPNNIITFQRFFFSVPLGLALVTVVSNHDRMVKNIFRCSDPTSCGKRGKLSIFSLQTSTVGAWPVLCGAVIPIALLFSVTLSPSHSAYNRLWHSFQVVPDDLQLRHYVDSWTPETFALANKDSTAVETSLLGSAVQEVFDPSLNLVKFRQTDIPLDSLDLEQRLSWFGLAERSEEKEFLAAVSSSKRPAGELPLALREVSARASHATVDLISDDTSWITISGQRHQQSSSNGIPVIYNSRGAQTQIFNSELIPVSTGRSYVLSITIRQVSGPTAVNCLAVIWYDRKGRLLKSYDPQPEGAGAPAGWSNGTYSYYGLVDQPAPTEWSRYTIAFGRGKLAAIPTNAAFIRIGTLLNDSTIPEAEVQITKISLLENLILDHLICLPSSRYLFSPASQAAQLSSHWPAQQVFTAQAGTKELLTRARAAGMEVP